MLFSRLWAILKNFDWLLLGAVILLICFGLAALYSIAASADEPNFSNFNKQIIFAIGGVILLLVLSLIDYRIWIHFSALLYGAAVVLLVAVLFFGTTLSGTTGWFSLFGFYFQPVELAKLALITFLAWFMSRRLTAAIEKKTFILSGLLTGLLFLLVVFQPDFGSGIILFMVWFAMMLFAGANRRYLATIVLVAIVAFFISWFFLFADYQRDRILTFFNPQADPYDRGYQVRQAVIAVGAGGLFGRGLGFGSQSQLKFIPASQTDFIFAVIAEELGFLGVGLVLLFFSVIFYRLIRAVRHCRDSFATHFILGVSVLLFIQVFINIGMNIGLVPVTGIPLPLVSYGGSFLLISLVALGLVESMIVRNRA